MASHTNHAMPFAPDRGDLVLSWLVKIAVILALLGVLVFDGLAVVTTRLSVEDQATAAARSGSENWQRTHSADLALASARSAALTSNPANRLPANRFLVDPDGTVHLTLIRSASTLVLSHVSPLRHLGTVAVAVSGLSTAS